MFRISIFSFLFTVLTTSCEHKSKAPDVHSEAMTSISGAHFFVNDLGDTIPTGVPLPAKGKRIDPDSVTKPKTVRLFGDPMVILAHSNVHLAGTPRVVPVPSELKTVTPGKDGVPLPKTVPARGKITPALQPIPIPASELAFKESATADIQYLGIRQGLRSSNVPSILEDKQGNLWFGSPNGVTRYDGVNFSEYTKREGLGGNTVQSMLKDSRGSIWFGTNNGMSCFDGTTFTHYTRGGGLSGNAVLSMLEDSRGDLWFGTENGASRFDGTIFTHYTRGGGLSGNAVLSMLEDSRGNLWFGTNHGVNRLTLSEAEGYDDYSFTHYTTEEGLSGNIVNSVLEDSRGNLWFGTNHGVSRLSMTETDRCDGISFAHYTTKEGLSSNGVSSMLKDNQGNLWFGTWRDGVTCYDGAHFTHYTTEQGLTSNHIYSMLEDSRGNLWFGTLTGGVNRYKPAGFSYYTKNEGLIDNPTRSLLADSQGNVWIGALQGGISRYHPADEPAGNPRFSQYHLGKGFASETIRSILEDSRGNLWFGTARNGVIRYDGVNFSAYTTETGLSGNDVRFMMEDSRGNLWFRTQYKGITRYNPSEGGNFIHFSTTEGLTSNYVRFMMEDSRGNFWFSTHNGGVTRYDPTGEGSFTHYTVEEGLSSNQVGPMLEDSQGNLWFGTDQGVSRLTLSKAEGYNGIRFRHYATEDGLSDNLVKSIIEDKKKNIWISNKDGITLLVPLAGKPVSEDDPAADTFQIVAFNSTNGLKQTGFGNLVCLDRLNRIWWGTNEGLTRLDLNQFQLTAAPPRISLNTVEVEQTFIDYRRLADTTYRHSLPFGENLAQTFDSVVAFYNYPAYMALPHDRDHLTFQFSAIDWAAPHKLQYSYLMEGLDQTWSPLSFENKADYRNMPPGEYIFKVKAIGAAQKWSEVFDYRFRIFPPWWQTWWARAIYTALILAIFYALYLWRTREQRKKLKEANRLNERLQQVDKLKDQFLANTSHELRTPLHGIIGITESVMDGATGPITENTKSNLKMVAASGKRLANLVNDILDFSKLKTHEIELQLKPVDLKSIAEVVLKMSEPLIKGNDLQLINEVAETTPPVLADENRLQQILINLVGNAIKFTENGQVKVGARLSPSRGRRQDAAPGNVTVFVEDTGIGIPEEKLLPIFDSFEQGDASTQRTYGGTGLGLTVTRQLVELHGGKIEAESVVGKGSTFSFSLPVARGERAPMNAETLIPLRTYAVEAEAAPASAFLTDLMPGHGAGFQILVVDDDPVNQQVLSNYLSGGDYILTQAMNGKEALAAIASGQQFDGVLLDVMMPGMSGYEVCRRIRETYLPSELPVLMVTAKNQVSDLVEAFNLKANDYLVKPISKKELLARLGTHLNLLHINQSYSRFVPQEFFKLLGREKITDVQLGDQVEEEVTVMFSDIRAYTTLSESMTAKDNFRLLNAYLKRIVPTINSNKGLIQQFLGDGIMALFMDKPENAIKAAIAYQQTMTQYNEERLQKGRRPLIVGIGLNTGSLMLGVIGNKNRMSASVVSDVVNTSSRMEGLTKHFGVSIIVSEESFNRLEDPTQFNYRYLGKVQVKGKKKALDIYEFFDGDPEADFGLKLQTKSDFESALQKYHHKNFEDALILFRKIIKTNPQDQAAQLYQKRAANFIVLGVAEDWEGVEVMMQK